LEFVLTVDGTEHAVALDEAYQGTFGNLDVSGEAERRHAL